ncbi:MAG: excinuclease ABC subunit UvrB [Candidatus Wildermuthbacteria bacterium]|nr:excinuclease ABC subunit UvrB [Candidatus Wildermuthbacteria bacterium]
MYMKFLLTSKFQPTGDQPKAIDGLVDGLKKNAGHQVLLGVTGSGKTYTISNVIAQTNRPTLVISPNKTLAAQLYQEFKEFFPKNSVHYFVSYYDYYQPEAYLPQSDTYIAKDAKVNDTLDRMRHEAAQAVLERRDVIVVASVSCIYGIGSPEEYREVSVRIKTGQTISRKEFLRHLALLQYARNDIDQLPGTYLAHGETVEIFCATGKEKIRVEFLGDTASRLSRSDATDSSAFATVEEVFIRPAKFWITQEGKLSLAVANIRKELDERIKTLTAQGKLSEAERIEQRTRFDLEMIEETGYCHGIENYSRHMEFRSPGAPPFSLLDYFPDDFLVCIDESHLTIPQIRAMAVQDRIRKKSLIEYGFRLPSALDNRPLTFEEFEQSAKRVISVSATPGAYECERAEGHIVEQLIRPTGLLEPAIELRPVHGQIQDLMVRIQERRGRHQRALVVTLTKRLAEEIASYLTEHGINARFLHSEVKTLERPSVLEALRRGEYDALVGVNLLREGLDLPEVSLVAILDADKEGFLRNETTLVQTMGRAARHTDGTVVLYANSVTSSMKRAMDEIGRRRKVQEEYNAVHSIIPTPIVKEIRPWELFHKKQGISLEFEHMTDKALLVQEMKEAAKRLDFERAAEIRDIISNL